MRPNDRGGRKAYTAPKVKSLNKEEARLLLEEHAKRGDKGANELLELLSEGPGRNQGKFDRKKAG
jgi:hypothetical protein